MKAALVALLILSCNCDASGGARSPRPSRRDLRYARIQLRGDRLRSGVTLTRARTAMYRAKTASNISGLLNPMSWLFGGLF